MQSDTNDNALDYTQYISSHLLKGKYYTGRSYDVMPDDTSLLGLLNTRNINIKIETKSLTIANCNKLISGQNPNYNEEIDILIKCLNYLIEKHSIKHIAFNFFLPIIIDPYDSRLSELKKNKAHIPLVLFSDELIWFFQRLNGIEYIGFYGEPDDFKQHLFIKEPIFNTIQATEKEKIPNTLKSSKTGYILFMQIQPQKKIYFINVTLKCLLNDTPSNTILKPKKEKNPAEETDQPDSNIEKRSVKPEANSESKKNALEFVKKFLYSHRFLLTFLGTVFTLSMLFLNIFELKIMIKAK